MLSRCGCILLGRRRGGGAGWGRRMERDDWRTEEEVGIGGGREERLAPSRFSLLQTRRVT
jgi:hypothetical protein